MSKFTVWLVTIVGLLPVALLSLGVLISQVLHARLQEQSREPGSLSLTGGVSVEIGPSRAKIHLSTKTWPAMVTVFGIVLVCVGMFFLLPSKPKHFERNGLSRLGHYVEHVIESHKDYTSVVVTKPGSFYAVLFAKQGGRVLLRVIVDLSKDDISDIRTKVPGFFADRGIIATSEFLPSNSGVIDSAYHFEVVLNDHARANAELLRTLFRDVFDVGDTTGLEFTTTGF